MRNYSQSNEQEIILDYFGDYVGTFLDIGCNDGETYSNTRALALKGWGGSMVDASPKAIDRAKKLYEGNTSIDVIWAAISDMNGKAILHESDEHAGYGDIALVSSLDQNETRRWNKNKFTQVEVPMMDFATLMENTSHYRYDFISADIEGFEPKLLPQINFRQLETKMVCVEWNSRNFDYFEKCFKAWDFKFYAENAENLFFVK